MQTIIDEVKKRNGYKSRYSHTKRKASQMLTSQVKSFEVFGADERT